MEVDPCADSGKEGATAADDGAYLPRIFMNFYETVERWGTVGLLM